MDISNVKGLVFQVSDMVKDGRLRMEDAKDIVCNLVDLDKEEPETEIEKFVYQWLDELK